MNQKQAMLHCATRLLGGLKTWHKITWMLDTLGEVSTLTVTFYVGVVTNSPA